MERAYCFAENSYGAFVPRVKAYDERVDFLRLARTRNVGPAAFFSLLKRFGSPREVLAQLPFLGHKKFSSQNIPCGDDIRRELDMHERKGVQCVFYTDAHYPALLKTLKDPPPVLSIQGRHQLLSSPCILAMVGSRNASQAGEKLAASLASALSQEGWVLVSGLAQGIDTQVHRASLKGGTVAVIAGGIGTVYPLANKKLYEAIAHEGVLVSEDPMGSTLHSSLFPKRNRLISALSRGVVVVEAGLRSGSLVTAKYALDQGRDVFAVPGHPLDPRARGVNHLLRQGAILVEDAQDILGEYAPLKGSWNIPSGQPMTSHATPGEETPWAQTAAPEAPEGLYKALRSALTMTPVSIDDLAHALGVSSFQVRGLLVEMELEGEIEYYPGDAVMRASPFLLPLDEEYPV